jgi:L,D-transpeptidase ErfK/SrfK
MVRRCPVVLFGFFILFSLVLPSVAAADMLIGGDTTYSIQKGDSLVLIGAKHGIDWQIIARENNVEPGEILKVGRTLKISVRRIVPKSVADGILVNIPDRTLYYFKEGKLADAFAVGLGNIDWPTPTGSFTIKGKEKNPTWRVPKSIQEEMAAKGEPVRTSVPPGPDNPLGRYALRTSIEGILLHETIWPATVYQFRSHGCIRVPADRLEKLYGEIRVGTRGEIIYEPVKIALSPEGRIFLEVHRDIYKKLKPIDVEVRTRLDRRGLLSVVDRAKVDKAVQEKTGIAQDVSS